MESTDSWKPPYPPSWFDRFTVWIERLPGPIWLFYVLAVVVIFCAETAVQWIAGGYPVGVFRPLHLLVAATMVYVPAFMHFLNRSAGAALTSFQPALALDDLEIATVRYRLTTLPARSALFVSVAGMGIGLAALAADPTMRAFQISAAPLSLVFNSALVLIAWFASVLLPYHLIRQLNLVSTIYTQFTKIRFLQLHPIYALSGLTVRASIGLLIGIYVWFMASPGLLRDPAALAVYFLGMALAVATFFLPLLGVHRLLEEEKQVWLIEASQRLDKCVLDLHRSIDQSDLATVGQIKDAISALDTELRRLNETPTWPWQPGTPRSLLLALLLPVAIWLLQSLAQRYLGI